MQLPDKVRLPIYLVAVLAWAALGSTLLRIESLREDALTIGMVWIAGFVLITGYCVAGPRAAIDLTRYWLLTLVAIGGLAGVIALLISV